MEVATQHSRRTGRRFRVGLTLHPPAPADAAVARYFYSTLLPADSRRDFAFYRFPEMAAHLYVVIETRAGRATAQARVSAPNARLRRVEHEPRAAHIVGVELFPGAAAEVLGADLSRLAADTALSELWGDSTFELEQRLIEAPADARVTVLRRCLAPRFERARSSTHAARISAIVSELERLSVSELAKRMGCSPRQLQRRWRHYVGMTPRAYKRLARAQIVLAAIAQSERVDWKKLAESAGYADHAHLVRDFAAIMGVSPAHLLREIDFVPDALPIGWLVVPRHRHSPPGITLSRPTRG
ncbi:MAG TPA: helix-turn-helix domain-containing protein [Polyangiaceae bacterium]|nr:helix-turn-helix domain-containing protein [Polyangiaceae bacterium]